MGRPAKPVVPVDLSVLCRDYTVAAVMTLVRVMKDKSAAPGARTQAASLLLDRGWGKVQQTFTLNVNQSHREMTDDELVRVIELARAQHSAGNIIEGGGRNDDAPEGAKQLSRMGAGSRVRTGAAS